MEPKKVIRLIGRTNSAIGLGAEVEEMFEGNQNQVVKIKVNGEVKGIGRIVYNHESNLHLIIENEFYRMGIKLFGLVVIEAI